MAKTCDECRQSFSEDALIPFGSIYICAGCKSVFLQRLREGCTRNPHKTLLERMGLGRVTSLTTTTVDALDHSLDPPLFEERVRAFLQERGFRNITTGHGVVTAERGVKMAALVNGDPLKNYQRILVSPANVTFIIDTWFMNWRATDFDVFRAETVMMSEFLGTGNMNDCIMKQAQTERKRSDFKGNLLFLGYLAGFLLLIMLIMLAFKL